MSNTTTQWILELVDKATAPLNNIERETQQLNKSLDHTNERLQRASAIDMYAAGQAVREVGDMLNQAVEPGKRFDASLRDVEAITGVSGKALEDLGDKARKSALAFGGDASNSLENYKTILSRLGPQLADNQDALALVEKNAMTLSKTMNNDVSGATDAITTSLLQYKVNLNDSNEVAKESQRMMNVMAAGAKEGASEVPQISEALKQAGSAASLAKVSFEESNSALQILAQSGKFGSEAGIGLRNVLTNMNAPDALSEKAQKLMAGYGINMKKVSDTTLPFSQRLKELAPIQNDINALTLIFGRENAAAAQKLIESADAQQELTNKITGTNVAQEQADVVMQGYNERMSRMKAKLTDVGISVFNATEKVLPFTDALFSGGRMMANWGAISQGFGQFLNTGWISALTRSRTATVLATTANSGAAVATTSLSTAQAAATGTTFTLTGAIKAASAAIMSIPVIGWILAIIAALVGLFVYLYNHSEKFRGIVWGVWEVIKMVWDKIWGFLQPIIEIIWAYISAKFTAIGQFLSGVWNWIYSHVVMTVVGIWSWIVNTFNKVKGYLFQALGFIGNLFRSIFGGAWNYVSQIFDKIWQKVQVVIDKVVKAFERAKKWVGNFFGAVEEAYDKGKKKGELNYYNEQRKKEIDEGLADGSIVKYNGRLMSREDYEELLKEGAKGNKKEDETAGGSIDNATGNNAPKLSLKDLGGNIGNSNKEKTSNDGMSISGKGGNKTITMTLNITNQFNVDQNNYNIREMAEKVVGTINDRLRDSVIQLG